MKEKGLKLEDYELLHEHVDVFLEEVARLPSKREIDFYINLVLGESPVSKDSYMMSIPELMEIKLKL